MANWYVRAGGSDNNGGTSTSLTPERSGSDLSTTNASTTITSVSASFTAGDVGKGIKIATNFHQIVAVTNSTTATIDRNYSGTGTNRTWAIGGAWANPGTTITSTFPGSTGDNVYIGAGTYRNSPTVGGVARNFIGDTDGSVTGDAGEIIWTQYTTNDKTLPSSSGFFSLSAASPGWSWSNITFVTGSGAPRFMTISASSTAVGYNYTFTNCNILSLWGSTTTLITLSWTGATTGMANRNILFDRCRVYSNASISITLPTTTDADYDANIMFRNCHLDISGLSVTASGANSFKGGGVYVYNCFIKGSTFSTINANVSTTYPCRVENTILVPAVNSVVLNANTSGQIVEDYNLLIGNAAPRTNVTAGANSVSNGSYAPLIHFGQEVSWGGQIREYGTPTAGSPLLGFGNSTTTGVPTIDINGISRPAGGSSALSAIGPRERSNTWTKETSTVRTGSNALSVTGPGVQDFLVPVDATSTTISVYLRYDSTYAGTRPQLQLRNGTECGVSDQTITASTSALNAWEQNSVTFTPTSKGIITIRLVSNDTAGTGKAFADSFSVS